MNTQFAKVTVSFVTIAFVAILFTSKEEALTIVTSSTVDNWRNNDNP